MTTRTLDRLLVLARQSLGALMGRRRFGFVLAVVLLPVALVALSHVLGFVTGGSVMRPLGVFTTLAASYYFAASVLVSLILGLGVVGDEVEGRTLPYLTTRPIPRPQIVYGKYLGLVAVGLLVLPSSVLASYLVAVGPLGPSAIVDNASVLWSELRWVALSVPAYGAAFTLIGAIAFKPVNIAVAYVFLWEMLFGFVPTELRRLTISHNLLSLSSQAHSLTTLVDLFGLRSSPAMSLFCLAALSGAYLAAAGQVFRHRQYVMAGQD